jgi:hypothetical protein
VARTANPNTPPEDDRQALATQVTQSVAAQFRILAMVDGKTVSDYLRDLVTAAVENSDVVITVNGKPFGAPEKDAA